MELVVLVLFSAGFWLLLIRPQQQRLRAQRDLIASLEVGERIVTAGGLIGTIVRLDDRDAHVEVAPGVVLRFLRPAISRRLDADEEGTGAAGSDGAAAGAAAASSPASGLLQPTGGDQPQRERGTHDDQHDQHDELAPAPGDPGASSAGTAGDPGGSGAGTAGGTGAGTAGSTGGSAGRLGDDTEEGAQ